MLHVSDIENNSKYRAAHDKNDNRRYNVRIEAVQVRYKRKNDKSTDQQEEQRKKSQVKARQLERASMVEFGDSASS